MSCFNMPFLDHFRELVEGVVSLFSNTGGIFLEIVRGHVGAGAMGVWRVPEGVFENSTVVWF